MSTACPVDVALVKTNEPSLENLALQNHLILNRIFQQLSLPWLKIARLVCKTWAEEAVKHYGKIGHGGILLSMVAYDEIATELSQLGQFLVKHQIPHSFMLSLIDIAWQRNGKTHYPYDTNARNVYKSQTLFASQVINYLSVGVGALVQSLRLELNLISQEDSKIFGKLLSTLSQLRVLSVDIISFGVDGFHPNLTVPTSLKAVAFRVPRCTGGGYISDPPGSVLTRRRAAKIWTKWMRYFGQVEFIDFYGWTQVSDFDREDADYFMNLLRKLIARDCEAFPNLVGLKVEISAEDEYLETFPIQLKHIYISVAWDNVFIDKMHAVFERHDTTLTTLNLKCTPCWYSGLDEDDSNHQIRLPHLPNLKRLGLSHYLYETDGYPALDLFNLRNIFQSGPESLRQRLPSLTAITLIYFGVSGGNLWEYIFPDVEHPLSGDSSSLGFTQIVELHTSLDSDCESPEVARLRDRVFPALKEFSHVELVGHDCHRGLPNLLGCLHVGNQPPMKPTWRSDDNDEVLYSASRSVFWDHVANYEKDLGLVM